MKSLGALDEAHSKVLLDIQRCLGAVQRITSEPCKSIAAGITTLHRLRKETYEDLNQIQHEHLIVRAAEWIEGNALQPAGTAWSWNPRQTGDSSEPDLRGSLRNQVVVSAEVTTSERPVGIIDKRMQSALAKLSKMGGEKFYFVRTQAMKTRAETKCLKATLSIRVVLIPL